MGLGQATQALYLNVSGGKLINKKLNLSGYYYEGKFEGIERLEDEYEGKIIPKIRLKMRDKKTGELAVITWTEKSWFTQGFFARFGKLDFTEPFTLGVSGSPENEKISFCWMKQHGQTVAKDDTFPKPEHKTVEGNDMVSYKAMLDAVEKIIEQFRPAPQEEKTTTQEGDDLPF